MGFEKLQQWLLRFGWIVSAVLLIRFAMDFWTEMSWWLAMQFSVLVLSALSVAAANVFSSTNPENNRASSYRRHLVVRLLLVMIPLGFVASSLDCTGLSLQGCSPFCTVIKLAWIPLIAGACLVFFFTGSKGWLMCIAVMSFVPLAPHCVCYNVGNGWWIDRIGVSPVCYAWGFVVSLIAIGALQRGRYLGISLFVGMAIIGGAFAFFISHHYFETPW